MKTRSPAMASRLSLLDFRNYRQTQWDFQERMLIVGRNASGKTNILEALFLLASSKSFRADREIEMIRWGQPGAKVTVWFSGEASPVEATARLTASGRLTKKSFEIDGQKKKSREFIGRFPMVRFTADDSRLIDGSPGRRRRALDLTLVQVFPAYHDALSRYGRVLASRNRLLEQIRSGEASSEQLDFWDEELIRQGQALVASRQDLSASFNERLPGLYRQYLPTRKSPGGKLQFAYQPSSADLASDISRRRGQDIALATTTAGPHRDDWQLLLDNRPLLSFGSSGEYRSAMLAFRSAEVDWLKKMVGVAPILLLDDVFSELDVFRRQSLLEGLPDSQVLITTPETSILPGRSADGFSVLELAKTLNAKEAK